MRGQRHSPAAPYPRERPGTHCTGGWVGLRAGLYRYGKSRPQRGFDPRTVQPVGSRYTDYATRPPEGSVTKCNCLKNQHITYNKINLGHVSLFDSRRVSALQGHLQGQKSMLAEIIGLVQQLYHSINRLVSKISSCSCIWCLLGEFLRQYVILL